MIKLKNRWISEKGFFLDEIIIIDLFGEEFRFKPDDEVENPEQVVQQLKNYIKDAEQLFPNKNTGKSKLAILLLAAMNLSKDHQELKVQKERLESKINGNISSLIRKIDKGLTNNSG